MLTLFKGIQEHHPAWLKRGENSSLIEHLVNTVQSIKTESEFMVIYKIIMSLPNVFILHLLSIAEAIAIHQGKLGLCVQNLFFYYSLNISLFFSSYSSSFAAVCFPSIFLYRTFASKWFFLLFL